MIHKTPLVSISVVTYNHIDYIKQCLDGILMQQTNFPFVIIIGEDESTDGTREICIDYANKHPDKINLFLRSRKDVIYINGNPTGRYNFIENLKASKGKYIAICEGDDYWTDPLKLQKQVDFLEANLDYNICFHKVQIYNQEENKFNEDSITREVPEITNIEDLARGNFIHTPSVLLRNNFTIPKWYLKTTQGDWALYMLQIKDKKIKKLNDIMAVYRVHDEGVWAKLSQEKRNYLTLKNRKLLAEYGDFDVTIKRILDPAISDSKTVSFLSRLKNKLNKN